MKTLLALLLTFQASAENFEGKLLLDTNLIRLNDGIQFYQIAPRPLIDRIAEIESGFSHSAIGDNGKSRGAWQMQKAAWRDVDKVRKASGLLRHDWRTGAHDPLVARQYAEAYLTILRNRLTRAMRRSPSDADMLAAWSMGFNGFKRAGFSLNNCPAWLQRKAKDL